MFPFTQENHSQEDDELVEADLLIAADKLTSFSEVKDKLEEKGIETYQIKNEDLNLKEGKIKNTPIEELKGKETILRNRRGFEEESRKLERLPLDFINKPRYAEAADDKLATKEILNRSNINTPETYLSKKQIESELEKGNKVVEKDRNGSKGRGFNVLEPGDEIELQPDKIYEEFVDHYENENIEERRAIVYNGKTQNKIIESQTRENDSGIISSILSSAEKYLPKNISAGGEYKEPGKYLEEEFETLWDTAEAFNEGLLGVDYTVDTETGETSIIEVNSTVGLNGMRSQSDEDIDEMIATSIEEDLKNENYRGRTYSNHLNQNYLDGETEEEIYNQAIEEEETRGNKPLAV
ncbi:MAG: RimK family alpha-L-glutamate ligase [Candidatus Nanohaloarchaea archaeon]